MKCIRIDCPNHEEQCPHADYCDMLITCYGNCKSCPDTECCNHPANDRTCEQCGSDCCPQPDEWYIPYEGVDPDNICREHKRCEDCNDVCCPEHALHEDFIANEMSLYKTIEDQM